MKTRTIEVLVMNRDGWFTATCRELEISGFGNSQREALESFKKSLFSTMNARLNYAFSKSDDWNENVDVHRYPLGAPVAA